MYHGPGVEDTAVDNLDRNACLHGVSISEGKKKKTVCVERE